MKKTMIALTMIWAAGLTVTMNDLNAAPAAAGGKITAPIQELVISGNKPARFSHAKHTALGLNCGTCHHDAKHQPLTEAAIAGMPKPDCLRCATCHTAPAAATGQKAAPAVAAPAPTAPAVKKPKAIEGC